MDFKIDYGPWETVFSGTTYGHEVEILSNPENFFLVIIYDKRDGKRMGAVIEGYKAFFARGQMEAFISTLPKPCFGVEKTLGGKTGKIFFLSFDPFYIDFRQEDFVRKIDIAIQKIDENSSTIVDLARASSLDIKELSSVPKVEYAPILGDPFVIKTLIGGQRTGELSKMDLTQNENEQQDSTRVIQLGLSKTREIMREQSSNLKRTLIVGQGSALEYASYILTENLLLENIPTIIFDKEDYFDQLGSASPEAMALRDELVEFEPIGFPMRQLTVKSSIKISLKDVDLFFLLDLIGFGDEEFQKNLSLICFSMRVDTPQEAIGKLLQTKELSEYEVLRAERIMRVIDKTFTGLFGLATPAQELTKTVPGKIGRALLIDTKTLSQEENVLFINTILRQITKSVSEGQSLNCSVIIPKIDDLFSTNEEKAITVITRLQNRGVGVVLGSEKELPEELSETMTAKINNVSGKDYAVSIKGKRNYRVILRPSLSGNPKL
ncbi:MAG: hypothetical protein WCW44_02065 [archaeon]|jgi:hypothetical protein